MAEQAKVTSVDAIEAFRSNLIVFLSKARPTLEEISGDVLRTRQWLENDQRSHWDKEMRIRHRDLEQAQGELFSARLSRLQQPTAAQYMAVRRAQDAVREAEEKQKLLKKWKRELENRTEPMVKLVDQLHGFLNSEMLKAVEYLGEVVGTLQAYAETRSRPANAKPVESAGELSAPESGEPIHEDTPSPDKSPTPKG
jgi:hypothetical protein